MKRFVASFAENAFKFFTKEGSNDEKALFVSTRLFWRIDDEHKTTEMSLIRLVFLQVG